MYCAILHNAFDDHRRPHSTPKYSGQILDFTTMKSFITLSITQLLVLTTLAFPYVLPTSAVLASPLTESSCGVSKTPAVNEVYIATLNLTSISSYWQAREVAKDLHVYGDETKITVLNNVVQIFSPMSWDKACEVAKDPMVKGVVPSAVITGNV
jgi:hypothetical protein